MSMHQAPREHLCESLVGKHHVITIGGPDSEIASVSLPAQSLQALSDAVIVIGERTPGGIQGWKWCGQAGQTSIL